MGQAAIQFGSPRGLARTTILTVMENLRRKGYLTREKLDGGGAYRYTPRIAQHEVMRTLVKDFIDKTLAGSVSPFVAYLAEPSEEFSEEEKVELRRLLDKLPSDVKRS